MVCRLYNQGMAEIMDDFENETARVPLKIILISIGILFLFLPIGFATGLCQFLPGVRSWALKTVFDPILYFGIFFGILHAALVVPLTGVAYPKIQKFPYLGLRVLTLVGLLVPPLVSYAYYRGGVNGASDIQELILMVVPGAILSAIFFEVTQNRWVMSAVYAVTTFIPIFVINDLMGSFPTWAAYASETSTLSYIRSALALTAILFAWRFRAAKK